jgi:UDP-N-acetylmuramate dehydrogenase
MSKHKLMIEAELPLSRFTTFRVGGPARYYLRVTTRQALLESAAWANEHDFPLLVLGGGSNLLVADHGFPGLVLHIDLRGVEHNRERDMIEVTVAAGENWHEFASSVVEHGWAGVECLVGIPGLVGATPIQNVGAYGQEVRDTLARVEVFDLQTGRIDTFTNDECGFDYRKSRFKAEDRGRYIILSVTFRLRPGGEPNLHHAELERHLKERGHMPPTLRDVSATVLDLRRRKSMILHEDDPNARSVGSFFVNPVLDDRAFAVLQGAIAPFTDAGERLPAYPTLDGRTKVSAAWLIEHVGFARGHVHGNVGLSSRHALALINRGGATAQDIFTFAREIRHRVRDRFGITLVPEPTLVGLSFDEDE